MKSRSHSRKVSKKMANRKSPSESATTFPEGRIMKGNDGDYWVVKKTTGGTSRWIPNINAEINGIRRLTVDYMAKNIGKVLYVYEKEYSSTFAKSKDLGKPDKFIPSGDAIIWRSGQYANRKTISNWLKTRRPPIQPGQYFGLTSIDGNSLQVDSKNGQSVSSNLMNMEAYVKV
jgi:hypothetical protein